MKKFLQRHSQVKNYAFILLIAIEFLMSFSFEFKSFFISAIFNLISIILKY